MIVVTTPTGFIGSKLVEDLLAAGERVRVIARDPDKLTPAVRAQVDAIQGSSDDPAVLGRALAGAESLFLVVPPTLSAPSVKGHYLGFTRPAIAAMRDNGVKRVVTVSAIGRRVNVDAGPVSCALAKDEELERAGLDVRALWCPGFMENTLLSLDSLRTQGAFFAPSRPDLRTPYVATRDIAAVAARLLCDRSWNGPGGVAVLGPEDLSANDKAAIMSEVLGRPIRYQQVPVDGYKAQLLRFGASEDFAQALVDMLVAKDNGLDLSEPRTPENTTPTSFREWCSSVLKPKLG
ncbi:MAG TPA: NAD(P)H-binding protein [Polyangiaceae bacterium]|nr:NAD(P)H-binding protein [Polyangiaceae bacterium]